MSGTRHFAENKQLLSIHLKESRISKTLCEHTVTQLGVWHHPYLFFWKRGRVCRALLDGSELYQPGRLALSLLSWLEPFKVLVAIK